MTCNSCNQNTRQNEKGISLDQIQNMYSEHILDLYRQGYRIPETTESLTIKDIGTMQYIWFGLFSYGSYASYKSKHNIWAIIFGGLALGSFGGIYTNYKK